MWFNTNACLSLSRDQGTPREEFQFPFYPYSMPFIMKITVEKLERVRNIILIFTRTIIYDSKSFTF